MPDSSGSAILSSASAPSRRRTKSASVSSCPSRLGGIEQVQPHAQLAQRRDERREGERHELGRHDQQHAVGHRGRLAPVQHVDLAHVVVGAQQPIFQPQLAGELHPPRLLGDERIGPGFDDEADRRPSSPARSGCGRPSAAPPPAPCSGAPTRRSGLLLKIVRRAQPGDATADDGDMVSDRWMHDACLEV